MTGVRAFSLLTEVEPAVLGLLLGVALVAAALLAVWVWRRRARARSAVRRRAPRLHHPVLLAHGFLGFDEVVVAGVRHAYFRDLTSSLARHAHTVHRPRVAATGSVASLTTIGSPHHGTPLADLGVITGERLGLRRVLDRFGLPLEALDDLTTASVAAFNRETPDVSGVAYLSVVGVAPARRTHPLLLPGQLYLQRAAGENDGLVPGDSQRWGEVLCQIEADHWAQIGWSKHFDAAEFYDRLLRELRARGL